MTPDPPSSEHNSAALRRLVEECIERLEADGLAAVEAVCASHPEHADAIRKRLRSLASAGLLPAALPAPRPGDLPEQMGEFRLLRRLGAGGMGLVFLAEQPSLHRQVALKVVRPEQLMFPAVRERFRREVETVARLQHPGIVPIYQVDEHQGVPFYAMEFVPGLSLHEALQQLRAVPLERRSGRLLAEVVAHSAGLTVPAAPVPALFQGGWVETCLRIARQVAEALGYAHDAGVLHRDVKPSNVMLTPDGRTRLLDFGLASTRGTSRMTQQGVLLGSIPYLPPEQLRGDGEPHTAAADVYGLGVTLFELLAGRPPFWGGSNESTRARVLAGDAVPLRTVNPSVPRDAETVCLKAMDRDPARRYPSMAALAADLANVLEFRPIQAERAGWLLRARRWSQRHPARAVAAVLGVLLLIAGPFGYGLAQARARQEVETALASAQRERERAERSARSALLAVDEMLSRVAAQDLADVPFMDEVRRDLLERAQRFLAPLLAESGSDAAARRHTAITQLRLGQVHGLLGRGDDERRCLDQAVEILDGLHRAAPADPTLRLDLARACLAKGASLQNQGADRAHPWLVRSVALWEQLVGDPATATIAHLEGLVRAQGGLAVAMRELGQVQPARDLLATAMERYVPPARASSPDHAEIRMEYLQRLGMLCFHSGEQRTAAEYLEQCAALLDAALLRGPRTRPLLERRHDVAYNLASAWLHQGEDARGERWAQGALEVAEELVAQFPARVRYRSFVAYSHNALAGIELMQERFAAALPHYQTAREIMERLVAECPRDQRFADFLATIRTNLATLALRSGQLDTARRELLALLDYRRARLQGGTDPVDGPALVAFCLERLTELDFESDDMTAARAHLLECVQMAQQTLARNALHPGALPMFRKRVRTLAEVLHQTSGVAQIGPAAQAILDGPRAGGEEARGAAALLCRGAELGLEGERPDDVEPLLLQAVQAIRQALARGYAADELRNARELAPLRRRLDFRALFASAASQPVR